MKEKPTTLLYTLHNHHSGIPRQRQKSTLNQNKTQLCNIGFGMGLSNGDSKGIVGCTRRIGSILKYRGESDEAFSRWEYSLQRSQIKWS